MIKIKSKMGGEEGAYIAPLSEANEEHFELHVE
jgi:hypothetical protein